MISNHNFPPFYNFITNIFLKNISFEKVMGSGFQVWEERYAKAVSLEKARPHIYTIDGLVDKSYRISQTIPVYGLEVLYKGKFF
jgi:hypothetical protein